MSQDCLFCKIASGAIDTKLIYEDDQIIAFNDINPRAPQHILIVPRTHIATTNDIQDQQQQLTGKLITTAADIAKRLGFAEQGYRLIFNCNQYGGQEIYHIHLHLLAGRVLSWPAG